MITKNVVLVVILICAVVLIATLITRKPYFVLAAIGVLVVALSVQIEKERIRIEKEYPCKKVIFYNLDGSFSEKYVGQFKIISVEDDCVTFKNKYGKLYEIETSEKRILFCG